MFKNYFTIAIRNLLRHKLNSSLNIIGLSIGLACALLIVTHVKEELSYDRGFSKADRIFRLTNENIGDKVRHWAAISPPMGGLMEQEMPEIEAVARFHRPYPDQILSYRPANGTPQRFEEKNGFFADQAVVEVFDLKFVQGNPQTALREVNTIVLTETTARKYFGKENPMGKVLQDEISNTTFTVSGVLQDFPFATHLPFDYLISMATRYTYDKESLDSRGWASFYTYILLKSPQDKARVEARIPEFMVRYYEPEGETREQTLSTRRIHLQPVTDIHLHSSLEKEMAPNSDITYVYIFSVAAFLILLLAAVNFINISTVQAFGRLKEIGVRKVVGAGKGQLIRQFIGESLLLTLFATVLAILLFAIALPFYNELAGKNIRMEYLYTLPNISFVVTLTLLTGIISGGYPAWFVANFHLINSLKGKKNTSWQFSLVRKGLVTFQFVVSVFMIFSTVIIYQQLQFFHTKDVGFDKEQLVAVKMYGNMFEKIGVLMKELKENPAVADFCMASTLPGDRFSTDMFTSLNHPDLDVQIRHMWVNANFLQTFNVELKEGTNFQNLPLSKTAFILNEKAAQLLGIEKPIGSKFVSRGDTGEVIGIVKDFHFASLHTEVEPLVIAHKPFWTNYMLINVRGGQLPAAIQSLEKTFQTLTPGSLFSYTFLDEKLNRLYETENRMSAIFQVFAGFAILISCLGLFGLSAYAAQLRTKEVGIRKVLGASIPGVVMLLSKDLLKLVLLAMLLAWPLAYWAASRWLESFAYQIDIGWQVFAISGVLAFIISLLTVSYQATKAALMNPVKSLRNE